MKFGAHSYIFIDRWSDACLPFLDRVKELDLDCLEIGVGDDVPFSCSLFRDRAEALGLELVISPGGRWPQECDFSAEDAPDRQAGLAWHKRQVDVAGELGAIAYAGSIYGHTGVVKFRRPPPEEYERTAEGLHLLADYAQAKGVAIVLEPMSHFRTHLVNTPTQCMRLLSMADHANLHMLLDTYHLVTEITDYAAAVKTSAARLWGIHACENNRGVPGSGLIPWDTVFRALVDIEFDGHIVMEAYNSSLDDFAFERGMFHNVCPNADSFIAEGLDFLKRGLHQAGAGQAS